MYCARGDRVFDKALPENKALTVSKLTAPVQDQYNTSFPASDSGLGTGGLRRVLGVSPRCKLGPTVLNTFDAFLNCGLLEPVFAPAYG